MAFGDGQSLHGGELVAACGVGDLQRAHLLITADHLAVGVLYCRDVTLPEGAPDEAQHQRTLPHPAGTEDDHAVVVTCLRHDSQPDGPVLLK